MALKSVHSLYCGEVFLAVFGFVRLAGEGIRDVSVELQECVWRCDELLEHRKAEDAMAEASWARAKDPFNATDHFACKKRLLQKSREKREVAKQSRKTGTGFMCVFTPAIWPVLAHVCHKTYEYIYIYISAVWANRSLLKLSTLTFPNYGLASAFPRMVDEESV